MIFKQFCEMIELYKLTNYCEIYSQNWKCFVIYRDAGPTMILFSNVCLGSLENCRHSVCMIWVIGTTDHRQ